MLEPLATASDLEARGVDTSDTDLVTSLLDAASAAVREAAGSPISEVTADIELPSPPGRRLPLPEPVRSVESVTINGDEVPDWSLVGGALWRPRWWTRSGDVPVNVRIRLTFGMATVPADIVDLVCNLVAAGISHASGGYEANTGKAYESIDDYRVGYSQGEDAVVSPMELPERTRRMLTNRFGGGIGMVVTRS